MEENKYTDLDKLFRDRLNKTTQEGTSWNLPSEDVFEGAMKSVHDDRRRRIMALWIFAGAALLTLITAFIINVGKVNQLERALEEQELLLLESRATLAELKMNKEEEVINQNDSEESNIQGDVDLQQDVKALPIKTEQKEAQNFLAKSTAQINQTDFKKLTEFAPIESKISQSASEPQSAGIDLLIPYLPSLSENLWSDSQIQISEPLIVKEKSKATRLKWYVGTTAHWTTLDMKGIEESSASLTEYDKRYLGYGVQAGLIQELPGKWSLDYRLSYQHFTNKSAFMDDLIYDEDLESVGTNGKTMYNMDISILSPMNEVSPGIAFEVDNYPIVDEDVFENVTRISEEYNWLTLAVIPKLDIDIAPNWTLSAGVGLQANYLMEMKEDMDVKLYFESEMMKNEIILNDPSKNVNPWSLAALGELNLSRELNERSSLSLTAGMQQSITPINTPKNGVAPRTYVNDLQLGLNFNFKI